MGGKSKSYVSGYKFYAGFALTIATFVDKLKRIKIGDKVAFEGTNDGSSVISVNKKELFGTKAEGDVVGDFKLARGEPTQVIDPYLASAMGAGMPANRGVSQLIGRRPWMGNNPYMKEIEVRGERVFVLDDGSEQWYVAKAGIPATTVPGGDAVYEFDAHSAHTTPGYNASEAVVVIAEGEWFTVNVLSGAYSLWATDGEATPPRKPWNCRIGVSKNVAPITSYNVTEYDTPAEALANAQANPIVVDEGPGTYTVFLWDGDTQAYNNRGSMQFHIQATANAYDINPAHMIREALTNTEWGFGYSSEEIDDSSFTTAADNLYAELFGLSYFWDDDSDLTAVVNKALDHIDGNLYVDPDSLKWKLTLNRDDYDPDTLLELTWDQEVSAVSDYKRPQFQELVNQVTINFYDTASSGNGSVTHTDSALFLQQGVLVAKSVDYIMCRKRSLAVRLLERELAIRSSPLASCTITCTFAGARSLRRGDVFKLTIPDCNLHSTIMRVQEVNRGDGKTKSIKIKCIEDRFAYANAIIASGVVPPPSAVAPMPVADRQLMEIPYAMLVQQFGAQDIDSMLAEAPDLGTFGIVAMRPDNAAQYADIYVDEGSGYAMTERQDFCPSANLDGAIDELDDTCIFKNREDFEEIEGTVLILIDDEIMAFGALNTETGEATGLIRGVFDTLPALHLDNAKVYFIEAWLDGPDTQYAEGESIDVKLLTKTSAGYLDVALAPADSLTFAGRASRPYPPANVKIGGSYYPVSATGVFTVTWAHRNRQSQQDVPVAWNSVSVTPAPNIRYTLQFFDATNTLLVQKVDIGTPTADCELNYTGDVTMKLWTVGEYGESTFVFEHTFAYTPDGSPANVITADTYTPYVPTWEIDGNGG